MKSEPLVTAPLGQSTIRTVPSRTLVYVKPSIKEGDPQDVLSYRSKHPDFPHQSTVDQWFDESQFESYRALGRFSVESALGRLGTPAQVAAMRTEDIFQHVSWL